MPGVDVLSQLGAARWITTDAARLSYAIQRARFDLMAVASRRALAGDLGAGNAEVQQLLDAVPQARGWVTINPAYPERSSEEMRRYLGDRRWLGAMLDPAACGQGLSSGASREVINAYRRYTKPLLVHVPDEPTARELEALALEFSTMKFVAAGAGGDAWQDCLLSAKRAVNIFLEPFSGGAHRGKLEMILKEIGHNRVVFASNYPVENPGSALGILADAKLSDAEKQAVLTGNAVRLFGLRGE